MMLFMGVVAYIAAYIFFPDFILRRVWQSAFFFAACLLLPLTACAKPAGVIHAERGLFGEVIVDEDPSGLRTLRFEKTAAARVWSSPVIRRILNLSICVLR
jgi:hypothetical protein